MIFRKVVGLDCREHVSRPRSLVMQLGLLAVVIPAGLATRELPLRMPFVQEHGGDVLWATMVFLGLGLILPRYRTLSLALAALGFAFCIEFAQLWQPPWLERIRATLLGSLILGHDFVWIDLLRYTVGVALGVGLDLVLLLRRRGPR